MKPQQAPQHRATVDLGSTAMKKHSVFHENSWTGAWLSDFLVSYLGYSKNRVLYRCRVESNVFYSPSRLTFRNLFVKFPPWRFSRNFLRCLYNPFIFFFNGFSLKPKHTNEIVHWLVGWVLWHINPCRLFNAKSIFIQINSSISNKSIQHKYTV